MIPLDVKNDLSVAPSSDALIQGVLQNDLLPDGPFYETWLEKPIATRHDEVNGYANSWLIDPSETCLNAKELCIHHPDGSVDIELVIEFSRQRVLYSGIFVSILSVLIAVIVLIFGALRSKKIPKITA